MGFFLVSIAFALYLFFFVSDPTNPSNNLGIDHDHKKEIPSTTPKKTKTKTTHQP